MAPPTDLELPLPTLDSNTTFLDPLGLLVPAENIILGGSLDVYDVKHIAFTAQGDLIYRGKLIWPKEQLGKLSQQLQLIYYKHFAPKEQADFVTHRSQDQSASNSSKSSGNSVRSFQQHGVHSAIDPVVADGTDASGLLTIPINIDATPPMSQAYKQFEPRGYKLLGDWNAEEHRFSRGDVFGPIAGHLSRKRKQIGLSREEVVLYGLNCSPCRPSNLSDSLQTTLFRQDNFFNTPQDVYYVLTPALKLAEKFMTDPKLIGYFATLAFGKRTIDMNLTTRTRVCHERLLQPVAVTDVIYEETVRLLNRLGKLVEYRFALQEEFVATGCFGFTKRANRQWNLAPQHHETLQKAALWPSNIPFPMARSFPKDPWDDGQVIHLNPDFYTAAKRFGATTNQDLAARLRFNFFFAVNIVHELAHVFELKSSQANFDRTAAKSETLEDFKILADPRFASGTVEAFWGNSTWAEAGGRWEWETFGGRVQPVNGKTDASLGMILFNGDGFGKIQTASSTDKPVANCIYMGFIEEVQQQSFWSRPKRTLRFPPTAGARGYVAHDMHVLDFHDHLRQRDEQRASQADELKDPADVKLFKALTISLQEDVTDPEERPSKRQRTDPTSTTAKATSRTRPIKKLPARGRLRQPVIRRYINKADADAKAMREEAMANVAKDEAERARADAIEQAAVEEARRYRSPSPSQSNLHNFFQYPDEDPHDHDGAINRAEEPYVDPATKQPEDLTLADKWTLAEEATCLQMKWEPIEFLYQRHEHPDWRPMSGFNVDDPESFSPKALDYLIRLRMRFPGQSWPERRAREKALYEQKRELGQRMSDMDELITYLGYSRIECHTMLNNTGKFPMGMTLTNFPAYRPLLEAFRLTNRFQSTGEYVSAVHRGQINAAATGVGLIAEDGKLNPQSAVEQTAKITDFFMKAPSSSPRGSQSREASEADSAEFPPLTRVLTPDEMIRKYTAWVESGADMRSLPKGLHPAQILSASLGGSLRNILPSQLQEVVDERLRQLEVEKEERRKRDAKERADAAEERSRRSGRLSGGGSSESEL